jgi:hypothetical protein
MKHSISGTEATVYTGTRVEGRRAREHELATHPIQYGTLTAISGVVTDVSRPSIRERKKHAKSGRTVDARGYQIWNGGIGSGSTPEEVRAYVLGLTVVDLAPGCGRGGVDPLLEGIRDAAEECKHGRLPGDSTPACGCWGGP